MQSRIRKPVFERPAVRGEKMKCPYSNKCRIYNEKDDECIMNPERCILGDEYRRLEFKTELTSFYYIYIRR
jgi:hypothetical protein